MASLTLQVFRAIVMSVVAREAMLSDPQSTSTTFKPVSTFMLDSNVPVKATTYFSEARSKLVAAAALSWRVASVAACRRLAQCH